jgi:hypothetical protein
MSDRLVVEVIPSPARLIRSLRDIGYEFKEAVADLVDNAIEAKATVVKIDLRFDGEDSYLTLMDNGEGMTAGEVQEALRFGTERDYDVEGDLGRFGLGLKTASFSQCEKFTVSSRRGCERAVIGSYCWDLQHIVESNSWEILRVDNQELKLEVWEHLRSTPGTVVTWERLGRLLEYKYPAGEHARRQAQLMTENLKLHLGMVFHRFLAGELRWKRLAIYVNDEKVEPWDPFSRAEPETRELEALKIPLEFEGGELEIQLKPYVLPPLALFSSHAAHRRAGGPARWNKQQGFYIYRANRIIQAGGWGGIRTSDEHTKLVRIAVFIPSGVDELFQIDIAKKHSVFPRQSRAALAEAIAHVIQVGQERYRDVESEDIVEKRLLLEDRVRSEVKRLEASGGVHLIDRLIRELGAKDLDALHKLLSKVT